MSRRLLRLRLGRLLYNHSPMRIIDEWDNRYWEINGSAPPDVAPTITRKMRFAWRVQALAKRWRAIWQVWTHWGKAAFDGWDPGRVQALGYRIKATVCLALDLTPGDDAPCCEDVCVVWYDLAHYSGPDGPGGDCQEVRVGEGLARNWWVHIEHESWP